MTREGGPQQLSGREKITLEVDQAQRTWQEAMDRLRGSNDFDELAVFTSPDGQSPEEVEEFLQTNEARLSEEGKFFLTMTINLRRSKKKLRETKG